MVQRNLDHMKASKEKLEKDNVELYSKMRYVSSFKSGGVTGNDVENHSYASEYENTLNPFNEVCAYVCVVCDVFHMCVCICLSFICVIGVCYNLCISPCFAMASLYSNV